MEFYELDKQQRIQLVDEINKNILDNIQKEKRNNIEKYFSHDDTYIRKAAYQSIGKIWKEHFYL